MKVSMYQASVPSYLQILGSMAAILEKAEAHCAAKKIAPEVILNFRLFPDMFPLTRQIQIMTDQVKGSLARLAGQEVPSWADNEASFADLRARVQKAIDFAKAAKPDQIDGTEDKDIKLKIGGQDREFKGKAYLFGFAIANFYFHASMTYAILRHCGVEVGKTDFLGNIG
jgi:hypothetical protein